MKSEKEKKEQIEKNENEKNVNLSDSGESNEENEEPEDLDSGVNLAEYITTPFERVLAIINEAKTFIKSVSKDQQNLIKGLEWTIKVISSHSLYAYEFKDEDYLNQMSDDNPDFKQFVDFVNSYNDQVIEMNKKSLGEITTLNTKRPITRKNTFVEEEDNKNVKEEKKEAKKEKVDDGSNKKTKAKDSNKKASKNKEVFDNIMNKKKKQPMSHSITEKSKEILPKKKISQDQNKKVNFKDNNNNDKKKENSKGQKKTLLQLLKKDFSENNLEKKEIETEINEEKKKEKISATKSHKNLKSYSSNKLTKKKTGNAFSPKTKNSQKLLYNNDRRAKSGKKLSEPNIDSMTLFKTIIAGMSVYSSAKMEKALLDINYNPSKILTKTFNIFELKEIIGQDNVLPIMGKTILDAFGLYSDDIISKEKLDPFLVSISNQYLHTTLYHNSMHGADVTQSVCLYFLNSNAEEVCQSLVLDLLGILIASLGHDLGHPGFTNPFHINASTELALTYNDYSCLENFHASSLFKTIRDPKYDIFEKLQVPDYKTIRKRMIGDILATDMANHGKIMTVIKSKISINMGENKSKLELLSGNDKTKFEEQQSLFDFLIHAADLAHNTKLFSISLKWVELLSEEFWLQGDKEKSMNLPVSFLCDRDSYDIPKSQIGFIKGFIIPTFETLVNAFPTLDYTLKNAKINLNRWQRLSNKGRKKGWTPEKTKNINFKRKITLFNAITNESENIRPIKRQSGMINSLSHELQIKDEISHKEKKQKKDHDRLLTDTKKKSSRPKIAKPNIIVKSKNHDKKVHINKIQKIK
jgi:hypothetical protein